MADYILIVDDDPDVLQLVQDVVEMIDIETRVATNGQQALEIAAAQMPCAIVLDLMMPIMDGYALIQHLQQSTEGRTVPIVLLSATADNNDVNLRTLPGVVGVLGKGDFAFDKLRKLVLKALGK